MSPLLGSSGGSSEYAFRGTLDDWPVDFAAALAAQNPSIPIDPSNTATATLTITGLNYKSRVIVEHPNVTVAVISEFGVAVTDGREVYTARKQTDPPLLIRDQAVLSIKLQPTSGNISDFLKTYTIPVKIGKRQGIWTVSTSAIDETPTSFSFNSLIDQQLGITTRTNETITIAGLQNGFSFPISVTANQVGGNVKYFKNGVEFIDPSTVVNGDQIYLSTLTPSLYSAPRTFTVQVGTFTTSWGILTRSAVTTVNAFSFTGISSANQLGFGYTSGFMTIQGADPGPASTDPTTWPTDPTALLVTRTGIGSFQIVKSDGNLRYTDPLNPGAPTYFQTSPTYAFNGDKINLKVPASTSYNTTTSTTLNVSDKSAAFNVTTRVEPIDSVPQDLTNIFTDAGSQPRGSTIESNIITLSSMSPSTATGTASISTPNTDITPQFKVDNGAWLSPPTTAPVSSGSTVRLRMTTPNIDGSNGAVSRSIQFRVDGIDSTLNTGTPLDNPEGFTTLNLSQSDTWVVDTVARNCDITPPTNLNNSNGLGALTGVTTNTQVSTNITFPSPNWNNDCRMRIRTNVGGFTAKNGITISPPNTELGSLLPTDTVTLRITSSPDFLTETLTTITITNDTTADPTITPKRTSTVTWSVTSAADTTPAELNLNISASSVEVGNPFTLSWTTKNCTSLRSVAGPGWTVVPTSLNGSVTLNAPITANVSPGYAYTLTAYVNPQASNVTDGTITTQDAGGYYITATSTALSVTENTSPIFTEPGNPGNSEFTSQLNVQPSISELGAAGLSTFFSNVLRVSDLSVKLSAEIDTTAGQSDPGAAMYINGVGPLTTSGPIVGVGTDIYLRIYAAETNNNNPTGYNTPTKAVVRFYYGTPRVEVANKVFTVTTRSCVPFDTAVRFPLSGSTSDFVNIQYYSGFTWTNNVTPTPTTTATTEPLLKQRILSTLPVDLQGTLSGYYRTTPLANTDPVPPATGTYVSRFSGSQGTDITWQQIIDAIWNTHIQELQRPPTRTFIENIINNTSPSTYVDMTALINNFIRGAAAKSATTERNTTFPILSRPCLTNIKTGTYVQDVNGNYV
jgi:hypothetical protein